MRILSLCFCLLVFPLLSFGQIVINEICVANADVIHDPQFLNFPGWVELHNTGTSSVNLGTYYLSDDAANKTKWRFPAGTTIAANGFLLIWCDDRNTGLHTSFNIDVDGETIILSNDAGELDRIELPEQFINISYGRSSKDNALGYLLSVSPGSSNSTAKDARRAQTPTLSLPSGRYSSSQTVSIDAGAEGNEIRFTTNGTEPSPVSNLYTAPISVSKTMTLKVKAFNKDFLPSETVANTFFINEHNFTLPVVSLSTKPAFLFDNTIGIITEGTNGVPGPCMNNPRNWNRDWYRHAVFEYFDRSGEKILDQNVDIRVHGGCSRNNPQKSLAIRARDRFGSKTIEHKFFSSKPINNFGALVLRNGGNDFYGAMMRDGLFQNIVQKEMDVDFLGYQPAIVYLNGAYWGIQNIREKIDADYIEANFGIDRSDVDILETGGQVIEGSAVRYNVYMDSLRKIDPLSPDAFPFLNRYIDVQEYINYLVAELYYCNTDWPGNNVKFWRQRSNNGKFRWILWDLDFGMQLYDANSYPTHETLTFATDPDNNEWPNPAWSTLHLRLLLQIPEFKSKLIQTLTTSLETTFKPERVIDAINAAENTIKEEMPYHAERWNLSMGNWNYHLGVLRNFAVLRNDFMKQHIADFFGLAGNVTVSLSVSPLSAGAIRFNGIASSMPVTNAFYYRDLPFDAYAEAAPGYVFSHFTVRKRESTSIPLIDRKAVWKYNDSGTAPTSDWKDISYADASWKEGPAELGYGDDDESTRLGYGDENFKFITSWFRKTFTVADTVGFSSVTGRILYDDGVVVYLNGEEVYRGNLPGGDVDHNTFATNQVAEAAYFPFTIPKGKLRVGENVIAVEIHQASPGSSDISFDMEISTVQLGAETETIVEAASINDLANSDVEIEAHFVPAARVTGIVINEISASNAVLQDEFGQDDDWIEVLNTGSEPVDLAGLFVSDKMSSKQKHLIQKGKNSETVVQPGAYKILWADDDVEQGALHLGFKLSADGEEIGLYQKMGELIETLDETEFPAQQRANSIARIPNATGNFTATAIATPLAENIFDFPVAAEETVRDEVVIYPNPSWGSFRLKTNSAVRPTLEVFNSKGQRVLKQDSVYQDDELSLRDQPSGVYLVRIITDAKVFTTRLVLK